MLETLSNNHMYFFQMHLLLNHYNYCHLYFLITMIMIDLHLLVLMYLFLVHSFYLKNDSKLQNLFPENRTADA